MKIIKKLITTVAIFILLLGICGCNSTKTPTVDNISFELINVQAEQTSETLFKYSVYINSKNTNNSDKTIYKDSFKVVTYDNKSVSMNDIMINNTQTNIIIKSGDSATYSLSITISKTHHEQYLYRYFDVFYNNRLIGEFIIKD